MIIPSKRGPGGELEKMEMTMSKMICLSAMAAVALMVGFNAPAMAQTPELDKARQQGQQQLMNAQAEAKKFTQDLAAEQPTTHNGSSSGPFLFTAYNNLDRGIWVTFYKVTKDTQIDSQVGQACIPPGKKAGIASTSWEGNFARIQVEVKTGLRCQGTNLGQKTFGNETVVRGGTSFARISGSTQSPQASFTQ